MGTTESPWATDPGDWVEAAPFRAHLRHLMDATGRSWQAIAETARISIPDAHRLLYGRRGRPVRRISPQTASRLFWVERGQLLDPPQVAPTARGTTRGVGAVGKEGIRPAA